MARLQMRLKEAEDRLVKKIEKGEKKPGWIAREQIAALDDRINFNEEAISYRRATTALVAMFQLCVLYKDAETLAQEENSPAERARIFRRIGRLTTSLRDFFYLDPGCSMNFSASYYVLYGADDRWLLADLSTI
jgi:hypothetical protein